MINQKQEEQERGNFNFWVEEKAEVSWRLVELWERRVEPKIEVAGQAGEEGEGEKTAKRQPTGEGMEEVKHRLEEE